MMSLDDDDFELLGLPKRFAIRRADLDAAWKNLQASVHPDRFAAEGAAALRIAMQWAVRVNEAYQRLKHPLQRASYLCALAGVDIGQHSNTSMPSEFLMQQIQWREALDDASNIQQIELLLQDVNTEYNKRMQQLTIFLDQDANPVKAALEVRALMFIERLNEEIHTRLHSLEDAASASI